MCSRIIYSGKSINFGFENASSFWAEDLSTLGMNDSYNKINNCFDD